MFITKMHLSRRTFLRGAGATIALPLLDGMIPALTALGKTAAKPVCRFGVVYIPNGMMMPQWTPAAEGSQFAFKPIMEPLAPFRDRLVVLTGLVDKPAYAAPGEGGGDHARAAATFLSGVHAKKTEGRDIRAGVSVDQIAAQTLGQHTQLASLELALESTDLLGACDVGYSCAYSNTIAWRTETTPLPMENDPRAVFERLFGDSDTTDPAVRLARQREDHSILDAVTDKVAALQRRLGSGDRTKLTEYLEAVRDVERRIRKAEEHAARELPVVQRPAGIPDTFEEHAKLMFDLQVLAYQSDLTRVITFMMAREASQRAYPEIGVADPHHPLSHHQNKSEKLAKLAIINAFHARLFAHFLEKLRATPDGEGSLLDNVAIVYGAGMSDSNQHLHSDLPILLAGGAAGQIKGGRHLRYPEDTPVTNLLLTLLDKVGVPAESVGDSTGRLVHLSGV